MSDLAAINCIILSILRLPHPLCAMRMLADIAYFVELYRKVSGCASNFTAFSCIMRLSQFTQM